jgi:putative ABC transport system substrate-binding protein
MRRREFIALIGGAAAWPLAARAQQPAMPVIGFLHSQSHELFVELVPRFRQGLKDAGYVAGENVTIEYRWAENRTDTLPEILSELVRRPAAAIAAMDTAVALAARRRQSRQSPSSLSSAVIRSGMALLPALPDRAAT